MNELQTIPDLTADFIRRVVTYTTEVTYFGENSPALAFATATAQQTAQSRAQYRALLRRDTLLGASGDPLTDVAEEYGAPRRGPSHSRILVIVRPWSTTVTAITAGKIEVEDSSKFEAGDSIRLTLDDGSTSEIVTINTITTSTGPNSGDELNVGLIVGTYDPDTDAVRVLLRHTLPAGTVFTSTAGIAFESLDDVTTGDANPVMAGESAALALADKVWCEAQIAGAAGNVAALTVTGLQTPDVDIRAVVAPSRAFGGEDEEADFALKFRAAHQPQAGAVETHAFMEQLARQGNRDVLRAFPEASGSISTVRIRVLTRSGGGLSVNAADALGEYMSQRMRSQLVVEVRNIVPTAVEIIADVNLNPGPGTALQRLTTAWRAAADRFALYLDWRKWQEETPVDEAELISILRGTTGISNVTTSTFQPAADVEVALASVPIFTRMVLTDLASGATFGADLATSY